MPRSVVVKSACQRLSSAFRDGPCVHLAAHDAAATASRTFTVIAIAAIVFIQHRVFAAAVAFGASDSASSAMASG